MKFNILLFLIVFSCFSIYGQEIKLNSTTVATAGNNKLKSSNVTTVNISKWRLGEVHLIQLQSNDLVDKDDIDWNVKSYPNPVQQELNLEFQTERIGIFAIQLTDISGKSLLNINKRTVLPNEVVKLDLSHLNSAMYLIHIIPESKTVQRVIKIQKQ